MPIYEYRCSQCQATFARLQRMGAPVSEVCCPDCGSEQVTRLVSAFASSSTSPGPQPGAGGCSTGGFT